MTTLVITSLKFGIKRADPLVDLIPPAAKRRNGSCREFHDTGQSAIPGCIATALDPEHALTDLKHLGRAALGVASWASSSSAAVAPELTGGASAVSDSGLVSASGSDSPSGTAPLIGAFSSDSL